MNSPFSAKVW